MDLAKPVPGRLTLSQYACWDSSEEYRLRVLADSVHSRRRGLAASQGGEGWGWEGVKNWSTHEQHSCIWGPIGAFVLPAVKGRM